MFFNARVGAQTRQNTQNTLVVIELIWRRIAHLLFALITLTFITANRVHKLAPKVGVEPTTSKLTVSRSTSELLGIIKKNRVHKLVAALRIELRLRAYETRQTTKPSQPL